jgi:hypothetical protein
MTARDENTIYRTGAPFRRVLAAVLLAGIVYSVSFGTVHVHRDLSQRTVADAASGFAVNTGTSIGNAGTVRSNADDCLICTFHRQLSFSTIDCPHFAVTAAPQIEAAAAVTVFYYSNTVLSEPDTHLSGRAPPLVG